jgi:hypothetical protein
MDSVTFHIGEVTSAPDVTTYEYTNTNQFEIFVKTYTDFYNRQEVHAIPLNANIKQTPLVGEHVLLVYGLSAENTDKTIYPQWYYISPFALNSNINANILEGIAPSTIPYVAPSSFKEQEVSSLQMYEGDVLVEGRFGNSIRLSSTISGGKYSIPAPWTGQVSGDPIIVLSNGRKYKKDSYTVENAEQDGATVYLTSTQKVPVLLGNSNKRNPLTHYTPSESQFEKSQFIGVADRIILKAKTDIAIIDSPRGIILNTTGAVKIGNDSANVGMVHSDVLKDILTKLIDQMLSGVQVGDGYAPQGGFVDNGARAKEARALLAKLDSSKYFITKEIN